MEDSSNCPLHKKGDKSKCSNYRGISLLNIGFKVLEAVLKNRLEPAYESVARKNQAGFKRNQECRDQIFTIRQLDAQRYRFDRQTVLVFVDFKAAFYSVVRNIIWTIVETHGLPGNIADILKYMYTETLRQVHI